MTQLLENKNAVIYGAGGAIGGGVARKFASEGGGVFLTGRTRESLDKVAKEITAAGGQAEVAVVDALDEQAVDEHARTVVAQAGSLDVSLNLISRGDVQGIPLAEMTTADFLRPITTAITTTFITAAEIGPHGVRVLGIWAAGVPDSFTPDKLAAVNSDLQLDDAALQGLLKQLAQMRMLRRSPSLAEITNAAAFLASDQAIAITGTFVNVTGGIFSS